MLVLVGCGKPQPWRVTRNLRYADRDDATFDLYRPEERAHGLAPTLVAVHGGGWRGGDKGWGANVADRYCPRGYAVVAVNYRLAPQHRWPAQYDDVRDAVAYLTSAAHALTVDPQRIALFGHSAGGHLASMVSLRGEVRVRCTVTVAGEGDLRVYGTTPIMADETGLMTDLLGAAPWSPELLASVSPAAHARRDVTFFIVHAVGDSNVFVDQSDRLHAALLQAGADVGYFRMGGGEHNQAWSEDRADDVISEFLRGRMDPERPGPSFSRAYHDGNALIRRAW